jgi:hypothetical protein
MATVTCKYTGIEFESRFKFAKTHPQIKTARNVMLARHQGVYQHIYMSAADRALDAAAPFALADVERIMAEAERAGTRSLQEMQAYFGEMGSEAMPINPSTSVYLSEWEMRGTDEGGE